MLENVTAMLDNVLASENTSEYMDFVLEGNSTNGSMVIHTHFNWDTFLTKLRTDYMQDIYGEYYVLSFRVSFVVCIVGYITNLFNIVVLASTPMSQSMNLFLLILSVADIAHITTQFSHIVHYFSGFKMFPYYQWAVFYITNTYFETACLYITNWLAVAIGLWRFMAITWPLQSRDWCSRGRAKKVIIAIFLLALIVATPVFAVLTPKGIPFHNRILYDKGFSEFSQRDNAAFLKFYWGLLLFEGFIPSLLLIGLTLGLIKTLYAARVTSNNIRSKSTSSVTGSNRTTVMLVILLILYVLSNLPDGCMFLISLVTNGDAEVETEYQHAVTIIRFFMLSNNSVSFFIYYGLGEGFRKRFHRVFFPCCFSKGHSRDESGRTVSEYTISRTSLNSQGLAESAFGKPSFGPTTFVRNSVS